MPITQRLVRRRRKRRYYGFVDAVVTALPDSRRSRQTLLLDCVDADAFDADPGSLENAENLVLVRTLTTIRRWDEDLGLPEVQEGDWVTLTLDEDGRYPRAWELPAANAYEAEGSTNLTSIALLDDEDGDGAGPVRKLATRLSETCRLPADKVVYDAGQLALLLAGLFARRGIEVQVMDVGQASCVAFLKNGVAQAFFDVGAPLYRNQKSFPKRFKLPPLADDAFVILSHWDLDHFDLGRRYPELLEMPWFAPSQPVGPNHLKFQRRLDDNLRFIDGPIHAGQSFLTRGTAPSPKDRNGNGYGLRLEIKNDVIVLTGDLDYSRCPPELLKSVTALTIPHHGGSGSKPPTPSGGLSRAIASYGSPNCYRHPDETYLAAHGKLYREVLRTASHRGTPRSCRRLYPA